MSSDAIVALSELVYQYATTCLSSDLVLFSKHAGRRTVQPDDVMLVARKDPDGLLAKLRAFRRGDNDDSPLSPPSAAAAASGLDPIDPLSPTMQRIQAMRERLLKGDDSSEEDSDGERALGDSSPSGQARKPSPAIKHTTIDLVNSFDYNDADSDQENELELDEPTKDSSSSSDEDKAPGPSRLRLNKSTNRQNNTSRSNSVISRVLAERRKRVDASIDSDNTDTDSDLE